MHPDAGGKVLKRKYSRSGCIECKRRKIKCNEGKPSCANCTRVATPCVYPEPHRRNKIRKRRAPPAGHPDSSIVLPLPRPAESDLLGLDMSVFENLFDDANTLLHGVVDYENQIEDPSTLFQEPHQDLKPFHSNIILNEIPSDMQDKKHYLFLDENELQSYLDDPSLGIYSGHSLSEPLAPVEQKKSNRELVELIIDKYKLGADEVQYFRDFALGPGCAYFFPFVANREENEVMKVVLEYCQYLKYMVYAMMAVSALMRFLHLREDADDKCQRRFTAICMRLLVQVFTDLQINVSSLWNVEGLILTILLRTMLFSDMTVVDMLWLLHLNEAQQLLIKYNLIKAQTQLYKPDLPGIIIAKQLFFCYDWCNRIALPVSRFKPGDAQAFRDLWALSGPDLGSRNASIDALIHLKVVVPNLDGTWFNTFNGCSPAHENVIFEFYKVFGHLNADLPATDAAADALSKIPTADSLSKIPTPDALSTAPTPSIKPPTEFNTQASPAAICRLMSLLDSAFQQTIVPGVSPNSHFLIPLDSPAHPHYPDGSRRIVLPSSAYGLDSKTGHYYSWCDAVLLGHVYFLYLKLLTCKGLLYLPRSHPLIKSVVRKIIGLMFFVKESSDSAGPRYYLCESSFDYRAIMIQLPLRLAIAVTDEDDDLDKLELFFRGMVKLGCGNCTLPLEKIKKCREEAKRRRQREAQGMQDERELEYRTDIYFY